MGNRVKSNLLIVAYFDCIDTEEKAYWLGFIAADGCIKGSKYKTLCVSLAEKDAEHLMKMHDALGGYLSIHFSECLGVYIASYQSHGRGLVSGLEKHGIHPRKTWTIVPWGGPDHLIRHYWRGVFDGDGWISGKEVGLVGNEVMVRGFRNFILKNTGHEISIYKNRSATRVQTGCVPASKAIVRLLYENANIFMERKKERGDVVLSMDVGDYGQWKRALTIEIVREAVSKAGGVTAAARELGVDRSTLYEARKRLGIL